MAEDEATWYELPNVTRLPLHVNDVESLRDLFNHPGWKVWMKIVRAEASKVGSDGLDIRLSESERLQNAAAFGAMAYNIQFETAIEVETQGVLPVKHEELKLRQDPTLLDLLSKNSS